MFRLLVKLTVKIVAYYRILIISVYFTFVNVIKKMIKKNTSQIKRASILRVNYKKSQKHNQYKN